MWLFGLLYLFGKPVAAAKSTAATRNDLPTPEVNLHPLV